MSNEGLSPQPQDATGFPELSALGKQLEMLRIGRGLSKQYLARVAGTSRQQLWRVMTGKSELTGSLRQRLAEVLHVEVGALDGAMMAVPTAATQTVANTAPAAFIPVETTLEDYLTNVSRLEQTLRLLPSGDVGRELKRTLLNALEDEAIARRLVLAPAFFDVRRRVLAREI